jgi:hypothetical protein
MYCTVQETPKVIKRICHQEPRESDNKGACHQGNMLPRESEKSRTSISLRQFVAQVGYRKVSNLKSDVATRSSIVSNVRIAVSAMNKMAQIFIL